MQLNGLAVVPAVELSGLFDPRSEGSLTGPEREILSALLANDERIDVAIPSDIGSDALWQALELCCKVQSRVRRVQSVLKMLVGRALILMQERPETWKARGFVSLDSMMSDEERGLPAITGISRGELYNAKKIAKAFPEITMTDYREIGFSKLVDLSKIVTGKDSNAKEWIETAKTGTQQELREKIYASANGIPPGSLEVVTVTLTMTAAERDEINEFLRTPEYQAYCKSALPGVMLLSLIAESTSVWDVQIRAQEEERR